VETAPLDDLFKGTAESCCVARILYAFAVCASLQVLSCILERLLCRGSGAQQGACIQTLVVPHSQPCQRQIAGSVLVKGKGPRVVGDSDTIQCDDRLFGTAIRGVGFSVFGSTHNSRPSYTINTYAIGATVGSADDSRVAEPLESDEPRRTAAAAHTLVAVIAAGFAVQIVEVGLVFGKKTTGAHK